MRLRMSAVAVIAGCALALGAGMAYAQTVSRETSIATAPLEEDVAPRGETYRTLCVRLCDGYYFPISTKTTRLGLDTDADRCMASCDGEARLFFHANPGGDVASARDFTGLMYEALPNAFKYLKTRVSGCSCRPAPWSVEETARHRTYAENVRKPEIQSDALPGLHVGKPMIVAEAGERPLATLRRAAPAPASVPGPVDAPAAPPAMSAPAAPAPPMPPPVLPAPAVAAPIPPPPLPPVEAAPVALPPAPQPPVATVPPPAPATEVAKPSAAPAPPMASPATAPKAAGTLSVPAAAAAAAALAPAPAPSPQPRAAEKPSKAPVPSKTAAVRKPAEETKKKKPIAQQPKPVAPNSAEIFKQTVPLWGPR